MDRSFEVLEDIHTKVVESQENNMRQNEQVV